MCLLEASAITRFLPFIFLQECMGCLVGHGVSGASQDEFVCLIHSVLSDLL